MNKRGEACPSPAAGLKRRGIWPKRSPCPDQPRRDDLFNAAGIDRLLFFFPLGWLLGFLVGRPWWNFTENLPDMADQVLVIRVFAVA